MLYALAVIAVVAWVLGFHSVAGTAVWVGTILLFASLLLPVIAGPFAIMLSQGQPAAAVRRPPFRPASRDVWWS